AWLRSRAAVVARETKAQSAVAKKAKEKLLGARRRLDHAKVRVTEVEKAIEAHKVASVRLGHQKEKLVDIKARLLPLPKEVAPFKALIEDQFEERRRLRAASVEVTKERGTLLREAAIRFFWIDGFGPKGIRSLLLESALPFLNTKVAEYIGILTEGRLKI